MVVLRNYPDYSQLPVSMAISPDGSEIAFSHLEHIYVMPLEEGAAQQQLTTSSLHESNVGWSPDGKFLAFTYHSVSGCGKIMVIPYSSSETINVESGNDFNPGEQKALYLQNTGDHYLATCGHTGIRWVD